MRPGELFELTVSQIRNSVELQGVLLAAMLAAVGYLLRLAFVPKGRVWWSEVFSNLYLVPQTDGSTLRINAVRYTIMSHGRKEVENLEVSFNWQPQHIDIYPHTPWTPTLNPDGRWIISFSTVNSGEFIMIAMLAANAECPQITNVRFKGGAAKRIETVPQQVHPRWKLYAASFVMFAGLAAIVWMFTRLILWIVGA